jgi:hypothetical protein
MVFSEFSGFGKADALPDASGQQGSEASGRFFNRVVS